MADESSLVGEHGHDVIGILIFVLSLLLVIIGFGIRKTIKILMEKIEDLDKSINGAAGAPEGGLIYKVAQLENGKRKKRK